MPASRVDRHHWPLRNHIDQLMQPSRTKITASVALLLGVLPLIAAHGDEHMPATQEHEPNMTAGTQETVPNYFRHSHYAGWMYAHVALMIVAWVITLPPALMLSIARSKHHPRNPVTGRTFGRLDGRCLLISFKRSTHSRWGLVRRARPERDEKFPMMILRDS